MTNKLIRDCSRSIFIIAGILFNVTAFASLCETPLQIKVRVAREVIRALNAEEHDIFDDTNRLAESEIFGRGLRNAYQRWRSEDIQDSETRVAHAKIGDVEVQKLMWSDSDGRFKIQVWDKSGQISLLDCEGTESNSCTFDDPVVTVFKQQYGRPGLHLRVTIDLDKAVLNVRYTSLKFGRIPPSLPKFPKTYRGVDGVVYKVVVSYGAIQG